MFTNFPQEIFFKPIPGIWESCGGGGVREDLSRVRPYNLLAARAHENLNDMTTWSRGFPQPRVGNPKGRGVSPCSVMGSFWVQVDMPLRFVCGCAFLCNLRAARAHEGLHARPTWSGRLPTPRLGKPLCPRGFPILGCGSPLFQVGMPLRSFGRLRCAQVVGLYRTPL